MANPFEDLNSLFSGISEPLQFAKGLIYDSKEESFDDLLDFINKYHLMFINLLKNSGIHSKQTLIESYSSVEKLINKFLTSFCELLEQEKAWFSSNFKSEEFNSEESNSEEIGPISGVLSEQKNFNFKDILFSRLVNMCALLFHNLKYEFGVEDISCKILHEMLKNTTKELRNLCQEKDKDLPEIEVQISFNDKVKTFIFSNKLTRIIIGRHINCDVNLAEGKSKDFNLCSRIHGGLVFFRNKFGNPTIALIDFGSLLGINEKHRCGFLSREPVFYLNPKSSDMTFKMGEPEVRISLKLIENN